MRKFLLSMALVFCTVGAMAQTELDLTQAFHSATYSYHSATSGSWYGKCVTKTTPAVTVECTDSSVDPIGYSTKEDYKRLWLQAGYKYNYTIADGYAILGYTLVTQSTTSNNKSQFKYTTADGLGTSPTQTTSNQTITVSGLHTNSISLDLTEHSKNSPHGILVWSIIINYAPLASEAEINNAKSIIKEGVGYPKTTSEAYIALNSLTYGTSTTVEVEEAVNNYNATTDVNMPVNGKAYVIKSVQNNGNVYILQKGESTLEIATVPDEITPAQIFVFRTIDEATGKYALVNADNGQYAMYYGISQTAPFSNGFSSTFAYNENVECHFIIQYEGATLSHTFSLSALRNRLTDNSGGYATMTIGRDNGQMNANGGIGNTAYSDSFSSLFVLEEVTYANTPKLNSVGESEYLTSDLHNKALGTFSAPFATVIPDGVTAYYATDGGNYITLNAIDRTLAVPANTGVILVGNEAGNVTMVPAASEILATIENNALSHSAGAAKDIPGNSYILSAFDGVAGFYRTTAGTLAMNKAYVEAESTQEAIEVRLPGTTGVEKVEMRNEKEEIYDLTGRRIENITVPGIYIINGVKRIVR